MPGFHEVDDPNIWAARRTHASFPVLPCEGQHDPRGSFYYTLGVELSGQLIITSIASGGKAERSGLRVGDRVVNLNGIDAAHLSLIDAAYILRREQSDVTLMRVEHEDGEEALARLENMESSPRVYENLRELHPPTPFWQPRERPTASHICTMSPCLEESESEDRDIISWGLKLRAPGAVHCTQCHSATGQFLSHGRTSDVRETAPAPTAVATTDSAEEGKNRVVTVTRHPLLGTGIRLIGGNAVGVFISDVNPQSSAAAVGVAPGDEILAVSSVK
ncbi:unnamed protein product [Dibothriocephalus latus]|uniref:PDZ domain-containing protein n=1 Tax=Dibothriocephalus latus TaxID=60516 RepID=A0A3P7P7U9_DIBLA|nr:unnamed protein product [Dibothriocephalus latus]